MIVKSEFRIPNEIHSEDTVAVRQERISADIGNAINKSIPFRQTEDDGYATRYLQELFVIPLNMWSEFKKEIATVLMSDHMGNYEKIDAVKSLITHLEKHK